MVDSANGKGDTPRPRQITDEEWTTNWDKAFQTHGFSSGALVTSTGQVPLSEPAPAAKEPDADREKYQWFTDRPMKDSVRRATFGEVENAIGNISLWPSQHDPKHPVVMGNGRRFWAEKKFS